MGNERVYPAPAYSITAGSEEFLASPDEFRKLPKGNSRIVKRIARGENSVPSNVIAACFMVE